MSALRCLIFGGFAPIALVLWATSALVGCREQAKPSAEHPPPANQPSRGTNAPSSTGQGEADKRTTGDVTPWRTDRFCVRAVQLRLATKPAHRVGDLGLSEAWLQRVLHGVRRLSVADANPRPGQPDCASAPPAEQLGVAVTLRYAGTSAKGDLNRPTPSQAGGGLYLSAVAHLERAGPTGKAEMADATVEAESPLVQTDAAGLRRRLRAHLAAASKLAVRRALGQLWVRHQPDTTVRASLKAADPWRRAAALQEVAERDLQGTVAEVERAARDSLVDVAVVACATLGRLGQARSEAVLIELLNEGRTEVADAALYALDELGTKGAKSAIQQAAQRHPSRWIRLRAKALLDAEAAHR